MNAVRPSSPWTTQPARWPPGTHRAVRRGRVRWPEALGTVHVLRRRPRAQGRHPGRARRHRGRTGRGVRVRANPPSARPWSESTTPPAARCSSAGRTPPGCREAPPAGMRREVQYIPQDPYSSLSPRRTTGQTLAEALDPHAADPRQHRDTIVAALEQVKLDAAAADKSRTSSPGATPAHRDRAGAYAQAETGHCGRDHLRLGRVRAGRDHPDAAGPARRGGFVDAVHLPQPCGGPAGVRRGGGHVPGEYR